MCGSISVYADDIDALVKGAKDAVQAANNTVSNTSARLQDITDDLNKIKIVGGGTNITDILNSVNNTCESSRVKHLTDSISIQEIHSSKIDVGVRTKGSFLFKT